VAVAAGRQGLAAAGTHKPRDEAPKAADLAALRLVFAA
jgi:hypothetical protein